jgi:hypothetical protein
VKVYKLISFLGLKRKGGGNDQTSALLLARKRLTSAFLYLRGERKNKTPKEPNTLLVLAPRINNALDVSTISLSLFLLSFYGGGVLILLPL